MMPSSGNMTESRMMPTITDRIMTSVEFEDSEKRSDMFPQFFLAAVRNLLHHFIHHAGFPGDGSHTGVDTGETFVLQVHRKTLCPVRFRHSTDRSVPGRRDPQSDFWKIPDHVSGVSPLFKASAMAPAKRQLSEQFAISRKWRKRCPSFRPDDGLFRYGSARYRLQLQLRSG